MNGETFSAIATALGSVPSTVKSAFAVAARNIASAAVAPPVETDDGPDEPAVAEEAPKRATPKRDALAAAFNAETHWTSCAVCSRAEASDEFCAQAKAYMGFVSDRADEKLVDDFDGYSDMMAAPEFSRARKRAYRYDEADDD
jgi:hypothetical protein